VLQFAVLKQSKVDFIRLAVNVVDIKVVQRKINISVDQACWTLLGEFVTWPSAILGLAFKRSDC